MVKRRFNEKGRQQLQTVIDNTTTKQIKLDFEYQNDSYGVPDDTNAVVLPSKKRPTKIVRDKTIVTKILSKKQRKRLEKIVDQKKKKEKRVSLISALSQVQATPEQLQNYTQFTAVQTKGLKQHFKEKKHGTVVIDKINPFKSDTSAKPRNVVGARKQRLALLRHQVTGSGECEGNVEKTDLNIIGIDEDSSDSEGSSCSESIETNDAPEISKQIVNQPVEFESSHCGTQNAVQQTNDRNAAILTNGNKMPIITHSAENAESISRKPATYIHVTRDPEVQEARLKLPILAEEQMIMELISENSVVIIAGETGSGKTTQVPQFLYEAGYAENGMIAITEPRRVAAISMSKRVAREMNLSSDVVSFLIRFEGNITEHTKIKFLTDGVLLKEIESDFLLSTYSVVILDEAHERSVFTDILVGLLSRIVLLRKKKGKPLKLIIMSATLRIKDFTENIRLFRKPPPVINVESRQFPVTVHFSKTTPPNYVKEVYLKAVKIHTRLPEGGILIFLTGQKEVNYVVKKLRKAFPYKKLKKNENVDKTTTVSSEDEDQQEPHLISLGKRKRSRKLLKPRKPRQIQQTELPKINLDSYQMPWDDAEGDAAEYDKHDSSDEMASDLDSDFDEDLEASDLKQNQPLWVLPLYSILPSEKQQRVFEEPPEGTRLCVVATNVAETSLTIPHIKYVIDSGRQKTKIYDKVTGVTAFVVTNISKASANQRAGRAGRIAPGHCYRIYSSAMYNDEFELFSQPEIQKKPIDDLVLQMKCMGIDKVINFPFPSPPDRTQLEVAENKLVLMEALEESIVNEKKKSQTLNRITKLGRTIAAFPVAPRFGKLLALSHQHGLLPYAICIVAALSVPEVLQEVSLTEDLNVSKEWRKKRKAWAGQGNSLLLGDPMILLRAVGAAEFANSKGQLSEFCETNGIRLKAIKEIRKLRVQLTNEINANLKGVDLVVDPKMTPPSDTQAKLLRQLVLIAMADQIARKVPESDINLKTGKIKFKYAYNLPDIEEPVFIHANSVLRKNLPEWVCYQEAYEAISGESTKMFIRGITAIEPEWLLKLIPKYCNVTDLLDEPEPIYDWSADAIMCYAKATIGKSGWQLPVTQIDMPMNATRCMYFAKFFIEGKIYPKLKGFRKHVLSSPESVLKSYSSSIARIGDLLKALQQNRVFTRSRLEDLWQSNPNFLLTEYGQFLPASCHSDVKSIWPPLP